MEYSSLKGIWKLGSAHFPIPRDFLESLKQVDRQNLLRYARCLASTDNIPMIPLELPVLQNSSSDSISSSALSQAVQGQVVHMPSTYDSFGRKDGGYWNLRMLGWGLNGEGQTTPNSAPPS